jgi:hypothetical protein
MKRQYWQLGAHSPPTDRSGANPQYAGKTGQAFQVSSDPDQLGQQFPDQY